MKRVEIIEKKRTKETGEYPEGTWDKMLQNGLSRTFRLIDKKGYEPAKERIVEEFKIKTKPKTKKKVEPINKKNERENVTSGSAHEDLKQE